MSENKVALNAYSVLDNELSRMHELMRTAMARGSGFEREYMHNRYQSIGNGMDHGVPSIEMVYQRILQMQDAVMKAAADVDPVIQEKIAELALTGEAEP